MYTIRELNNNGWEALYDGRKFGSFELTGKYYVFSATRTLALETIKWIAEQLTELNDSLKEFTYTSCNGEIVITHRKGNWEAGTLSKFSNLYCFVPSRQQIVLSEVYLKEILEKLESLNNGNS